MRLDRTLLSLLVPLAMACGGGDDPGTDDTVDTDADDGVNEAPGAPEVTISPELPTVGTPLTVSYAAVDPDGDDLTYTVKWTVDAEGVQFPQAADTIPGDAVVRGQTWTATVFANDGELRSKAGRATVTIGNAAPVVDAFTWGPVAPRANDTLFAEGAGTDPDGDRVTVGYRWKVGGTIALEGRGKDALAPGDFAKGDTVVVTLILEDGQGATTEQDSDPIVIGNIAPSAPAVRTSPRLAKARDTLSCEIFHGGVDPDGDALTYEVSWLRDGVTVSTTTATVGQVVTQVANTGSVWTCTARSFDGTDRSAPAYASVPLGAEPPDVAELTLGDTFSCAARADGHTACWGLDGDPDASGLVGTVNGRTSPPEGVGFSALAAGDGWACGVGADDFELQCWGAAQGAANPPAGMFARVDAAGDYACAQALDSTLTCWKRGQATLGPAYVPPEGAWRTFGVGASHACGVAPDGVISCWGLPGSPMLDAPEGTFLTLSANGNHTCALADDRSLACWGDNADGQSTAPTGAFLAVAAGGAHTCAIAEDRSLVCWGADDFGQATPPAGEFEDVWAGLAHTCARDTDGAVVCWGYSAGGLLEIPWGKVATIDVGSYAVCQADEAGLARCYGLGISGEAAAPYGDFVSLDVNTTHVCGLTAAGEAICWGSNAYGETTVPVGGTWDAVATGLDFSCGIHSGSQQVECWGNPGTGAPPLGTKVTKVPTGRFSQVSAGGTFACAMLLDGTVDCWGTLGGNTNQVFTQISSGATSSCGVAEDQSVKCWGTLPFAKKDGVFQEVSVGSAYACALRDDGSILCWGNLTSFLSPIPRPDVTGFTDISTGDQMMCALDADQRTWCWGAWGRQPLDAGL